MDALEWRTILELNAREQETMRVKVECWMCGRKFHVAWEDVKLPWTCGTCLEAREC